MVRRLAVLGAIVAVTAAGLGGLGVSASAAQGGASVSWAGKDSVIGFQADPFDVDLTVTTPSGPTAPNTKVALRWPYDREHPADLVTWLFADGRWITMTGGAGETQIPGQSESFAPGTTRTLHLRFRAGAGDFDEFYRARLQALPLRADLIAVDRYADTRSGGQLLATATYPMRVSPLNISASWPRSVTVGRSYVFRMAYHNDADTPYTRVQLALATFSTPGARPRIATAWSESISGPWHSTRYRGYSEDDYPLLVFAQLALLPMPAHAAKGFFVRLTVLRPVPSGTLSVEYGFGGESTRWGFVQTATMVVRPDVSKTVQSPSAAPAISTAMPGVPAITSLSPTGPLSPASSSSRSRSSGSRMPLVAGLALLLVAAVRVAVTRIRRRRSAPS
ncbi:MAG: hypothetical protein QOG53_2086 [Frankiales bacterium]|nr:hypothetical protein [Frankiales bacterium]